MIMEYNRLENVLMTSLLQLQHRGQKSFEECPGFQWRYYEIICRVEKKNPELRFDTFKIIFTHCEAFAHFS